MKNVSRTEILNETSDIVSTNFREAVEENGRGIEMRSTITSYALTKAISFHLDGNIHTLEVEYTIEKKVI
jgi:hypothetical protein